MRQAEKATAQNTPPGNLKGAGSQTSIGKPERSYRGPIYPLAHLRALGSEPPSTREGRNVK